MNLHEKIAEQLSKSGGEVTNRVIEAMVERELNKRTTAVSAVFDLLNRETANLRKIRPDVITYGEDGTKTSEGYSKAKIDERKKSNEMIEKLTKALTNALEKGEFDGVYGLSNNKGGGAEGQ